MGRFIVARPAGTGSTACDGITAGKFGVEAVSGGFLTATLAALAGALGLNDVGLSL
jgi:hypothetical protein